MKWLMGRKGLTLLLLAALVAELTFAPPTGLLWWAFTGVLKGFWSAFRLLPDTAQIYAGGALALLVVTWWFVHRYFGRIVLFTAVVTFLPWLAFGTKMTILFWGLLVSLPTIWLVRWLHYAARKDEEALLREEQAAHEWLTTRQDPHFGGVEFPPMREPTPFALPDDPDLRFPGEPDPVVDANFKKVEAAILDFKRPAKK